jgi:hypothetical protein
MQKHNLNNKKLLLTEAAHDLSIVAFCPLVITNHKRKPYKIYKILKNWLKMWHARGGDTDRMVSSIHTYTSNGKVEEMYT